VKLRENKAIHNSASRRASRTKLDVVLIKPAQLPPGITSAMSLALSMFWQKNFLAL